VDTHPKSFGNPLDGSPLDTHAETGG
jgi:hypothetical protein